MVCKRSADYVLISVHGYVKINTIRGFFILMARGTRPVLYRNENRGNVSYASIGGAGRR